MERTMNAPQFLEGGLGIEGDFEPIEISDGEDNPTEVKGVDFATTTPPAEGNARSKVNFPSYRNRSHAAVATILSSFGTEVENCVEKFIENGIEFRDLSALCDEDLELLGVKSRITRKEMLQSFVNLPNQAEDLARIKLSNEAKNYNDEILGKANAHLDSMKTSLAAAHLKLRVHPASDVVVEERSYASRIVVQSLEELRKASDEMDVRLKSLEVVAAQKYPPKKKGSKLLRTTVVLSFLAAAVSCAYWIWKNK